MRIRRIVTHNFCSHEVEEINLPAKGIFFLDGKSGTGKSSFIVDAPLYALFGPRATRGDLRHLDYPDEAMNVEVVFEFDDGELLALSRGINSHGVAQASATTSAAPDDSPPLADSPSTLDRYVRNRLGGMSWQQLRAAFVCHQKEVAALTDLSRSERKRLIHRLLGIRELELAQEQTKEDLRDSKAGFERLSGLVGERTRAGEETRLKEAEKGLEKVKADFKNNEAKLSTAQNALGSLIAKITPLEKAEQAGEETVRLQATIAQRIKAIEEMQAKLIEQNEIEKRIKQEEPTISTSLQQAQIELDRLRVLGERTKQYTKLIEDRKPIEGSLKQIKGQIPKAPSVGTDQIKAQLAVVASEIQNTENKNKDLEKNQKTINEEGVCTSCRRPWADESEKQVALSEIQSELDRSLKTIGDFAAKSEELEKDLLKLQKVEAEIHKKEREYSQIEGALKQINEQITVLSQEGIGENIGSLRDSYKEKDKEVRTLNQRQGELIALRAGIDLGLPIKLNEAQSEQTKDQEALRLAEQAKSVPVDINLLTKLRSEANQTRQTVGELTGQLIPQKIELKRLENECTTIKKDLEKFQTLLLDREVAHDKARRLELLFDYLDSFTRYLASEIRPAIEEMATEMIYQISGGRFVGFKIDEDYNIELQRETANWIKPSSISGGEEGRANLCLRLALTRLVSQRTGVPVQFIVLDEPFGNLDPELIEVSMGLLDSLRNFYPQIFVISHTGDMTQSQHVDYRLAFEDYQGRNRIKLYQR